VQTHDAAPQARLRPDARTLYIQTGSDADRRQLEGVAGGDQMPPLIL
jgi:hypothetical protein